MAVLTSTEALAFNLTHRDADGEARMVEVGAKAVSERRALAEGRIHLNAAAFWAVEAGELKKGDALATARIAGIMASKSRNKKGARRQGGNRAGASLKVQPGYARPRVAPVSLLASLGTA